MLKKNEAFWYDLFVDLTLFLYEWPEVGESFYNDTVEFLEWLYKIVIKIQTQLKEEEAFQLYTLK